MNLVPVIVPVIQIVASRAPVYSTRCSAQYHNHYVFVTWSVHPFVDDVALTRTKAFSRIWYHYQHLYSEQLFSHLELSSIEQPGTPIPVRGALFKSHELWEKLAI